MEDEDRQWDAIKSVGRDFIGLTRSGAEELAQGLALHPTVLDWDVLGKKTCVQLPYTTRDDIIVRDVEGGVVTRAEPH